MDRQKGFSFGNTRLTRTPHDLLAQPYLPIGVAQPALVSLAEGPDGKPLRDADLNPFHQFEHQGYIHPCRPVQRSVNASAFHPF